MSRSFAKSAYRRFLVWGILSSMVTTLCTFVDSVLVGNFVGSDGLAVTNLATPVYMIYALAGITLGVGANVQIGRCLGADQADEANRLFRGQLLSGLALGVAFALLAAACRDGLCRFLGAEDALLPLARRYITVVLWSAPLFVAYHILSISVRTDGDPRLVAAASAVVVAVNLSLDLVFMGLLHWGIIGASAALCIAEALGVLVLLAHFAKKHSLLRLRLGIPTPSDIKGFAGNGFGMGSACVFQGVVMLLFNKLLLAGGEDGVMHVAVFGILYTVSTVPFAVFDGAASAISTVTSILAGEKDCDGMMDVLGQGLKTAVLAGVLLAAAFLLGAEQIVRLFGLAAGTPRDMAALALRVFSASVLFTGINTVVTSFWQSIGRRRLAGVMSVARNFALMLVFGVLFIPWLHINGVSLAYVCSEALCSALALGILLVKGSREFISWHYRPTGRVFERYYTIRQESVAQISADLEQLCDQWEIAPRQAFFMNLMVEELLLNIAKFGMRDAGRPHYIDVKVMDDRDGYAIRIRDDVRSYNPFDARGDEVDTAVIHMIREKTKYCDYQRKLVFNYLYLII